MKVFALAGLLAVSSAVMIPRITTPTPVWNITNFSISGAPFSTETLYTFDITDGTLSTTCSYVGNTLPEISGAPYTNCADATFQFSFGSVPEIDGDGFNLEVWENTCGSTCVWVQVEFFPQSDLKTVVNENDPNGDYEYLDAPAAFSMVSDGTHI